MGKAKIEFKDATEYDTFLSKLREFVSLKIPFKHMGRSRRALDCAGVPIVALREMGYEPADLKFYTREPYKDGLQKVTEENLGEKIQVNSANDLKPCDILLLKFTNEPHHVAVVADYLHGGLSLIHSYGEVGRVVEHRLDEKWFNRIKYAYRIQLKEQAEIKPTEEKVLFDSIEENVEVLPKPSKKRKLKNKTKES